MAKLLLLLLSPLKDKERFRDINVNGGFSSIGVTLGGALALRFEPRTQMRNDYAELKLTQVWNRRGTCFCLLLYLSFNKQKDSTVLPL